MKLIFNHRVVDLSQTKIMGILNVTPDSFFDGGQYNTVSKSIDHVADMIDQGATFIDIGGESTRPGSIAVSVAEEAERVLPVVQAIVKRFDVLISINTSRALIIREASDLGVHLINDVRSLSDVGSLEAAVHCKLPVCLMHTKGSFKTMQDNPRYFNIIDEINDYFIRKIERCRLAGLDKNKLLLDPGFGFGKSRVHNYQLLARIQYFHHFKLPLLVGMSRKSMLNFNNINYRDNNDERLIGSLSCAIIAAMKGVHIVRVHDVRETFEALQIVHAMQLAQDQK